MIETTKETIKFARSWLENAEKYGDPNAPTTGTMTALARAVMELADEVKKLENINMDHLEELDRQEWLLDNANEELAALKEKYRWRKQSEEPAPEDEVVEAVYLCKGRYCGAFYANRDGRELKHCDYWRPLDLPEAEAAE